MTRTRGTRSRRRPTNPQDIAPEGTLTQAGLAGEALTGGPAETLVTLETASQRITLPLEAVPQAVQDLAAELLAQNRFKAQLRGQLVDVVNAWLYGSMPLRAWVQEFGHRQLPPPPVEALEELMAALCVCAAEAVFRGVGEAS